MRWRLIPLVMLLYLVNIFDRANVAFAALTMNADLGFSPAVYGFGAGSFFVGYTLFQVPANLILERVGARRWIFFILMAWGAISASTAFVQGPMSFYVVRVLLGIAEAGFFPGMMLYMTYWFPRAYRARFVARFMSAAVLAFVVGGPLSSLILEMDGIADRFGRWWVYFDSVALMALVAVVMAAAPRTPDVYNAGVLSYAFTYGRANAAFSAIVLHAIGRGAASAKYAIVASFGNVPAVYMTAFDGWMYDRSGAVGMLTGEALLGMGCIVLGLAAVWRISGARVRIADRVEM
jgi:MFS family permease